MNEEKGRYEGRKRERRNKKWKKREAKRPEKHEPKTRKGTVIDRQFTERILNIRVNSERNAHTKIPSPLENSDTQSFLILWPVHFYSLHDDSTLTHTKQWVSGCFCFQLMK